MTYCRLEHVTDLILKQVAEAAVALNPELVARSIEAVSGEIADLLAPRYPQPFEPVPEIIRWIASVFAAWRTVGGITSLMDTEAGSDNPWLPLQTQYRRAWDLLMDLAGGKQKLAVGDEESAGREAAAVKVAAPGNYFDLTEF